MIVFTFHLFFGSGWLGGWLVSWVCFVHSCLVLCIVCSVRCLVWGGFLIVWRAQGGFVVPVFRYHHFRTLPSFKVTSLKYSEIWLVGQEGYHFCWTKAKNSCQTEQMTKIIHTVLSQWFYHVLRTQISQTKLSAKENCAASHPRGSRVLPEVFTGWSSSGQRTMNEMWTSTGPMQRPWSLCSRWGQRWALCGAGVCLFVLSGCLVVFLVFVVAGWWFPWCFLRDLCPCDGV